MPLKLRTQIHPFSGRYNDSIVERDSLINIFNNLNTGTKIENAVILVEDEPIKDNYDRIPKDGSRVYIRIMPEGEGWNLTNEGDRKNVGAGAKALGGIMTAIGVVLMFSPAAPLGALLSGVGVAVTLTGVALYNMELNIPSVNDRTTPKQDPSLRGGSNQSRPYGSIPVVFGRHLLSPDYAATPYTYVDGNNGQWLRQLFCLGYDDQEVETESLKIDETKLTDFSSGGDLVHLEFLRNGTRSNIYSRVCKEIMVNSVLKNLNDSGTSGAIIRTTCENCRTLNVDIFFPNGLFAYNDKGNVTYAACAVTVWYKPAGSSESRWSVFKEWNLHKNTTKTLRVTYGVNVPIDKYDVKVERITSDNDSSKIHDEVYLGSIRAYTNDHPVKDERAQGLLLAALEIKASDMAQGVIDKLNLVTHSVFPDWNGQGSGAEYWTARATANPASCVLYCLRGKINSDPINDEKIDWQAFEHWWSFCDQKQISFNAVLSSDMQISELIAAIAKVGRANIVKIDGLFTVAVDELKTVPVQAFTPRNSISFSEQILMADIPDQLDYNFIDEAGGWAQNTRSVFNTPTGEFDPNNPPRTPRSETSVWGITNANQLFKFARYQQAVTKLRRSVYSIKTDVEFIMCSKGDLIEYSGDAAMIGSAYGRIKELIMENGLIAGIVSDTLLEFDEGVEYGLRVRNARSGIKTVYVQNTETSDYWCRFEEPIEGGIQEGDLFTFGVRGRITKELVVLEMIPGENLTAELKCVDLAPAIFRVDKYGYVIPPFESKLTLGGTMDSGYEDTKNWNTYRTYNDSREKPTKPTGDGSENGWHRVHTSESRWESHKNARNIYEGDWSSPLATVEQVEEVVNAIPAADTTPPSVPEIRDVAITKLGDADITFSPSTDLESGVAEYNVWLRKKTGSTLDTRWQIVGKVPHDGSADGFHFLCQTSNKFETYLCAISAVDKNFNESAKCSSFEFLSEVTADPDAPRLAKASAERDFVHLEAKQVEGSALAYTGRTYEWQLSKDGGETWSDSLSLGNMTGGVSGYYVFDREKDGWPEAENFESWRFRVRAVSYYDRPSEWTVCSVTTSFYGTWKPTLIGATAKASMGRVTFDWSCGDCFGSLVHSVWLNGVKISGDLSARQYIWTFSDYKERSDLESLKLEIRATSESGEIARIVPSLDLSEYGTYKIQPPEAVAAAEKEGVTVSWKERGEHYLTSTYDVYFDGMKVLDGLTATEALIPYSSRLTVEQAASLTVKVVARTAADFAEVTVPISISNYKGWVPTVPTIQIWGYGRNATVSWIEQDVWGSQGCEIQIAKAYKVENGVKSVINDEDDLDWFAPLLAGNPYSSLDAYKKGDVGGWLSVRGIQASFSLPLYGQPDQSEATQYAYRIRAFTDEDGIIERSAWTAPAYFTAMPITAADVVKAWKLNDNGERVKVDGALGAAQIFAEELSALSANLGVVTDGGIAGNAYNYWAISDTVLKNGTILPRGSFRIGGPNQYIKVDPIFEEGEPTGRYNIEFVVGSFSVSAEGDIGVSGRVFTIRDLSGNIIFQSGPGGTLASVSRSEFQRKGLFEKEVGEFIMKDWLSDETTHTSFFSDTFGYKGEAMCLFSSCSFDGSGVPEAKLMLLSENGSKSLTFHGGSLLSEVDAQFQILYVALYLSMFRSRHVVVDGDFAKSAIWTIDLKAGAFSFNENVFSQLSESLGVNSQDSAFCFNNSAMVTTHVDNEKQGSSYVKKQTVTVLKYDGQTVLSFSSYFSASGPAEKSIPCPVFYGECENYGYLVCQRTILSVYRINLSDYSIQACFLRGEITDSESISLNNADIAPLLFKNGHLICSQIMSMNCVMADGQQTQMLQGYIALSIENAGWIPSNALGEIESGAYFSKIVMFEKAYRDCITLGLFSNDTLMVSKANHNEVNGNYKTTTLVRMFDFSAEKTSVSELFDKSAGIADKVLKPETNGFPFGYAGLLGGFSMPLSGKFFAGRNADEDEYFAIQVNNPNFVLKFCRIIEVEYDRNLPDELHKLGVGFTEVSRNASNGELTYYISDEGIIGEKRAKLIFDIDGNLIAQKGDKGPKGEKGDKGDSLSFASINAYVDETSGKPSVDVKSSGSGSEKNVSFTFSGLKGVKGDKGETGPEGKSAYELALAAGFSGTQTEWLASLKGEQGIKGDKGDTGESGRDGHDGASIARIEQTVESLESGGENIITVYDSKGDDIGSFTIYNGSTPSNLILPTIPGTLPGYIWMD